MKVYCLQQAYMAKCELVFTLNTEKRLFAEFHLKPKQVT